MRKIIHYDMDYFFAQVEERDNPALRGRPIGVGGSSLRGVLSTCNYIARGYGVSSAMPTFIAKKKCPDLVLVKSRYSEYQKASRAIFDIFHRYTDKVQGISIDEAYLDVSHESNRYATSLAKEIQKKILDEVGLTGSAGVSYNKLLAKIASNMNKPHGITVFAPGRCEHIIKALKVEQILGVGKVTTQKMHSLGLKTFADLQALSKGELVAYFGEFGIRLFDYCRGIDPRPVKQRSERKSLSVERTFEPTEDRDQLNQQLESCVEEMTSRLSNKATDRIGHLFVKIKFSDFTTTTIEKVSLALEKESFKKLMHERLSQYNKRVRLLGCGVRFKTNPPHQLVLL